MGRQISSHLSLLHRVSNKQQNQKDNHGLHANNQLFSIGDTQVLFRGFPNGKKWLPGIATQSKGPLSFLIELDDGRVICHHIERI